MAKKILAVAHEEKYVGRAFRQLNGVEELTNALAALIPNSLNGNNVVFACIGTDRSTGDSLGPLVGTYLEGLGYTVVGTMEEPLQALNLAERLEDEVYGRYGNRKVIAIDASLGQPSSVGLFSAIEGPFKPGAGVGKDLPEVGDYSIMGIVNVGGFMEYFVLQNTRMSLVMSMAKDITSAIVNIFPLAVDLCLEREMGWKPEAPKLDAPKPSLLETAVAKIKGRKRDAKGRFVRG